VLRCGLCMLRGSCPSYRSVERSLRGRCHELNESAWIGSHGCLQILFTLKIG